MNAINPVVVRPTETLIWEGRPGWRSAAFRIWHVRLVIAWFAFLAVDGVVRLWRDPNTSADALLQGEAHLLAVGVAVVTMLVVLAALTARTTRYTITDRRVIMCIGIGLRAKLAIPFGAIAHVGVRIHPDQTGDIALRLIPGQSVLYPKLWPHARPWRLLRAEPMLRCIALPGVAGAILCRAIAAVREKAEAEQR
jgi:hypothetical protein